MNKPCGAERAQEIVELLKHNGSTNILNGEADVMKKACHRHLLALSCSLPAIFGKDGYVKSAVMWTRNKSADLQGFFIISASSPTHLFCKVQHGLV